MESARRLVAQNNDDLPILIPPENGLQMSNIDVFPEENISAVEDTKVDSDFTTDIEDILYMLDYKTTRSIR